MAGDAEILRLMPAAKSIATALWWTLPKPIELDELVAEANALLVEAWAKYDPDRGCFEHWAKFKVRRGLLQYLRNIDLLPRADRKRLGKGYRVEQQFVSETAPSGLKLSHIPSREISPYVAAMAGEILCRVFTPPSKTRRLKPPEGLETMDQAMKRHAIEVVQACGNNRSRAAGVLGVSRSSLWALLKAADFPAAKAGA